MQWREIDVATPPGLFDLMGGLAGASTAGGVVLVARGRSPRLIVCIGDADCSIIEPDLGEGASVNWVKRSADALWLLGAVDGVPALWSSPDGAAWLRHSVVVPTDTTATITEFVATADAMLAIAPAISQPSLEPAGLPRLFVWRGHDGGFTPVDDPHPCLLEAATASVVSGGPTTLIADGDGFLAGMPAGPMSPSGPGATVFYRSPQGVVWNEADSQPTRGIHINDLAWSATAYVAVATADDKEAVWFSTDLAVWERVDIPARKLGVNCGPSGCAVLGMAEGAISMWLSADGRTWEESTPIVRLDRGADMGTRGFVVGDGVVAVWGQITGPDNTLAPPRVWLGNITNR